MAERFRIPHVSTGDLLRAAIERDTPLGRRAKTFMDRGTLVPDDLVVDMVAERLREPDCRAGVILDGFPRTVGQARALEAVLARLGLPQPEVIDIEVPREDLIRRLSGRRTCRQCGAPYHTTFDPPAQADHCDRCGGPLFQREDDREETIRTRLEVYERDTAPVRSYYRDATAVHAIDGRGAARQVFARILAAVNG
jgi:adenylate kinase